MNLCDPALVAPSFVDECTALYGADPYTPRRSPEKMSAATVPPSDTEKTRWPWCTLRPGTLGRVRAHVDTMALAGDLPSPVHSAPTPG